MQDPHFTPQAQKLANRALAANYSFQNAQERRNVSTGRDGIAKRRGLYHNQPRLAHPSGGKIVLKKINHYFDNKKINKLYRNNSKIREDKWRVDPGPLLYHRGPALDGRAEGTRGSQGSGSRVHNRRSSGQPRTTKAPGSRSRAEPGQSTGSKKYEDASTRLLMNYQGNSHSLLKKSTQRIYG